MPGFDAAKVRSLALLWVLALLVSAALVLAGRRWSDPLTPQAPVVWALLLLPPLATGLWLLRDWSVAAAGERGESEGSTQEQQR
jgi:ABC-type molybdate transport system permease subunit